MPEEFDIEPVHAEENEQRSCRLEKLQNKSLYNPGPSCSNGG